jgi:uncharacterized protein YyaL (SSP411 family)
MRNRLSEETSPYLLQHADNPVHWQAWTPEALELARAENKPILLSVGYSACHWCHVMAHEPFEDADTARVMNDLFVNIKVDREERPDIDKIYQTAHQLFTGRPGGWPLTVFLTPDSHVPIFTGTYFPKDRRYGMPSFREVLTAIDGYYRTQGDEIRRRGASLADAFAELDTGAADDLADLSAAPPRRARERLAQSYDREHGGFGNAPKCPHTTFLALLLAHWQRSAASGAADERALAMVTHTLDRMALGGLYDQLGGGFYSTLDADSEHEEGKFYVWTPGELNELLTADESRLAKVVFGLTKPGSPETPAEPNFEGKFWHLHIAAQPEAAAAALGMDVARGAELLASARRKLLAARERRVWPARDDKSLVSWNGLMIGALARAARRLDRPELAEAATAAVDFIRAELWSGGRLKAVYKDGRARFAAYLDDYAFLAAGLLELLQCRWRGADLDFARELADALLAHFEDERGGFFFTANDHEQLIHKPKPFADEAVPSGNGVAAGVLVALGHLLGEQRYLDAAERTVRAGYHALERYPEGHATLLRALEQLLRPPELVVVRGAPAELAAWQRVLDAGYRPFTLSFAIPADAPALPGLLADRAPRGTGVAYVCEGMTCRAPIDTPDALATALGGK